MKIVNVKITYPDFLEDIEEIVKIEVPEGLSEEDENKHINKEIEDKYKFLYGY